MAGEALFDVSLVVKVLKAAHAQPANFAFGDAGAAERNILAADRHKTGEQLFALVKKERIAKGFWGTVTADGTVATFVSEKPGPGQQKLLEEWFRKNRVPFKAVVTSEAEVSETEAEAPEADQRTDRRQDRHDREASDDDEGDEDQSEDNEPTGMFTADVVRKNLLRARTKPVQFAFGLGKTVDEHRLALHPRYPGVRLALMIRKENGATRGSFGTVDVDGTVATFRCEKPPIPGLKKLIRTLFKDWKLMFRVVIFGPDGEVDEPEDETDDAPQEAAQADPAAELARLRAALDALLPILKEAAQSPERLEPIRAAWRTADAALKAGDTAASAAAIEQLRALAGPPEGEDDAALHQRWRTARDALGAAGTTAAAQLTALKSALLRYGDADLDYVAKEGLPAIGEAIESYVAALMSETEVAEDAPRTVFGRAATKALKRIEEARRYLDSERRIGACDDNPFNVAVTLRATMGGALDALTAVLHEAA